MEAEALEWSVSPTFHLPGVDLRPVHVRFLTDMVALGQVSLRVSRLSPITIITRLVLSERQAGEGLGNFLRSKFPAEKSSHL